MVKKKGPVWNFFNKNGKGVSCKYCSKDYKQSNAFKMERHIRKCFECPTELKNILTVSDKTLKGLLKLQPLMIDTWPTEKCTAELEMAGPSSVDSSFRQPQLPSAIATSPGSSLSLNLVSPSSTPQSNRILPFRDQMDAQTQEMLNHSLAKAVFISGSPLSIVEHPLWIEFFRKIRPSYTLPSRFQLSSTYLDAQYTEMLSEINQQLKDTKNLYMHCDGWSNLQNKLIVNFVVSKPEPYFVDLKMSKTKRQNPEDLAQLIGSVMEKYDPKKFLVVIADNTTNMRSALTILKEKYPHIVPLGCIAHLLHLLCSDILGSETVKNIMVSVTEIVTKIKESHFLNALFDEISEEKKFNDRVSLKLPGKTRWESHLYCLKSLRANKIVLETLAVNEKAELGPSLKKRLLDNAYFWPNIEKMIALLNPIVNLISFIELNKPKIHCVVRNLNELGQVLKIQLPLSPLVNEEKNKVLNKFRERKDFSIGPIHMAANLMDPKAQGNDLNASQLLDAITFVCDCAEHMKLNVSQVRENLADYRDKEGLWARNFLWEGFDNTKPEISPLLWWRTLRGTCELADVAIRILGAPVTSAATGRTSSTYAWIHSKVRNTQVSGVAAKLSYLSYNWTLMNGLSKPKSTASESPKAKYSDHEEEQNIYVEDGEDFGLGLHYDEKESENDEDEEMQKV